MAGITVTVGGVNITAYVDVESIVIDEIATSGIVGTARFDAWDNTGTITIAEKATVVIADDGVTIFAGEVVDSGDSNDGIAKSWKVTCQDYNILLDETVIESEAFTDSESDSEILAALFAEHRADVNAVTYVATLDATMEDVAFAGMTLREILDDLASRTSGRYYVDYDKNLHWFSAEVNAAAFGLSTEPDYAATFPFGGFSRSRDAGQLANKVLVVGKEVSGWVEDVASQATYGVRHAVNRDQRITTAQGVTDRGNAILDRYDLPRSAYECWTYAQGLRAGMSIALTNSVWGISAETFYIRRLRIEFLSMDADTERRHYLWLNDEPPSAEVRAHNVDLRIGNLETVVNVIDDTVFDTDAPAVPALETANLATGVDLDADGHAQVYLQVTWGSVADADLDHYDAQISTEADFAGYTITRSHPAGGDRIERFLPVLGNTVYYARVRAVDWVGNVSAWSTTRNKTTAKDTTAPDQVAGLIAAGARTLINLTWTASAATDLAYYEVQRATTAGGVYATIGTAKGTIYSDSGHSEAIIQAATTYYYKVRAVDTSGNAGTYSAVANAALNPLGSDSIAANAIIAIKIAANTITADKMNVATLSAIAADMGTITAGTVTGATIRTAASGARCQMDSTSGYQAYNSSAAQTFSVQTSGAGYIGVGSLFTWNTAGTLAVNGSVMVSGTVVATAFSNTIATPLFTAADGLALWGPHAAMTATSWTASRGQTATISGAFHQGQGAWSGTRGLVVEAGTTNLIVNPQFYTNITDGWTTYASGTAAGTRVRYTTKSFIGPASLQLNKTGGAAGDFYGQYAVIGNSVSGTIYVAKCRALAGAGATLRLTLYKVAGTGAVQQEIAEVSTATGQWVELETAAITANATGDEIRVYLTVHGTPTVIGMFDAVQCEVGSRATSYCDGTLGWCAWSGTAHNSTSTRTQTVVSIPDAATLLSGKAVYSIRCVAQMPYAAAGTWPYGALNALWVSDTTDVAIYYSHTSDAFEVHIEGGVRITSAAQTFAAGDHKDIVLTCDYTNDIYTLYIDGVRSGDTYLGARTSPTLSAFYLGTYSTNYWAGFNFSELALLGAVLTADEVAAIHILGKPLVDAGAFDLPGVYIGDGRFRLYSSETGARTEIDVTGIKAYGAAQSVWIKVTGDTLLGSNITAAATTAIAIFATAQTYNSESVGAGDVLFGDNSANKANMLWDVSDGLLRFRGGTTTQVYIATDGALMAGGGAIKISAAANLLFSVASATEGIVWYNAAGFTVNTDTGYIQVATSTGIMTINTGGDGLAGWKDFYIQTRSSDGSTRTPVYIDAGDKLVGIYQGTPLGTVHIKQDDAAATHAVLVLEQEDVDAPYIRFLDATVYTGKSEQDEYIKIQLGGSDRYIRAYS